MYAFFFDYRSGIYKQYAGLFTKGDDEDKQTDTFAWFGFFYSMAKGCPVKMSKLVKLNFIYLLNFKAYETKNKKQTTYYEYGRYNITDWATAKH